MVNELEFEKPVIELKRKIAELKEFTKQSDVDLSSEIEKLEARLSRLEEEIYENMDPWDRIQIARFPERPTSLDYIQYLFTDFLELHGDRVYGDDGAVVGGIAKFEGLPVTVIGQQRGKDTKENIRRNFGMPHPEGYRKAMRLMKQAEKFKRPIISFIDTKGAYPGKAAEERGIAESIARNLFEMSGLSVPIICLIIGEGASGGALGIGVGDHIHVLENSWFSVISPESAAALLWKDASQAKRAVATMKMTAPELKELGIIDELIPEVKGGAHKDPRAQAELMRPVLAASLKELRAYAPEELVEKRYEKYRKIGVFSTLEQFARQ
ncbi:acetyl-CoA carboxylase carboxyl transferase subunit alpha [Weizmannia coagulans]|jgi:acetyl-CoA carboxylase carboxyl transferase subunit alpha|uniref:Acetyl-coenzyme A carboxylase carboxyl transferase subunit alpha n=3 Tax=Heyndrickxia TaxID=2837504 RepID=G2TPG4_HEYCO|nr:MULTISPECIES: acetyl-CoA carboxylase carboxyl transferase subunit alpha [Heyndrickxia]AEP01693.1 acetyl-CoA carboxylase, carboxyl transferase, alpha subunit [Heyndrickxia coagulans 36D1]AJO22268.1 acetyl-CoA carboxylase, carboxyl transferase subunit alpha [Heyndrickxia coagulans]AKN56197.1 Acetyl-coenzyme A carboxyl transferase alpha chain [Heyndrickxia coagulans]APB36703.1 acetyl-CoA carboxylase carboxyltransferase subunit alpha [Heyndrickxia coagulans]ATW82625.1 acetyl-CoA carboxylase car